MKKIILILINYFSFLIYNLCVFAQNTIRGLKNNVKKYLFYFFSILFVFFLFVLYGQFKNKRTEIYNLSIRNQSVEQQLEQYRKREITNIRNLEVANNELKQFRIEFEKYGKDVESIKRDNIEIRKQLNNSFKQIKESRNSTNRIIESINSQSNSIDDSREIIKRIQSRGKISEF